MSTPFGETDQTLVDPGPRLNALAFEVIGAAIEVHRTLGPGFLESIYEASMMRELRLRGIAFERQIRIPIEYKGELVGESRLDLLVGGDLVVELKSVDEISRIHTAQVLSYLKAGAFQLGLLINFKSTILTNGVRRLVWSG